ncbi:MAG: hypothetical protein ABIH34_04270, partial [Nanoarchaeota archaeon]
MKRLYPSTDGKQRLIFIVSLLAAIVIVSSLFIFKDAFIGNDPLIGKRLTLEIDDLLYGSYIFTFEKASTQAVMLHIPFAIEEGHFSYESTRIPVLFSIGKYTPLIPKTSLVRSDSTTIYFQDAASQCDSYPCSLPFSITLNGAGSVRVHDFFFEERLMVTEKPADTELLGDTSGTQQETGKDPFPETATLQDGEPILLREAPCSEGVCVITQSPVDIHSYFEDGSFADTEIIDGKLTLLATSGEYAETGEWISPVFSFPGERSDDYAIWNTLEGDANWHQFNVSLVNGDFEQGIDDWYFSFAESQDCTKAASGSCSMKLVWGTEQGNAGLQSGGTAGGSIIYDPKNVFSVYPNDIIHVNAYLETNFLLGGGYPVILFLKDEGMEGDQRKFSKISGWNALNDVNIPMKSDGFEPVQTEFNISRFYVPGADHAYLRYQFEQSNLAPGTTAWIDDIEIFKASRINVSARSATDPECTEWSEWFGPRLLFKNQIQVPAPIGKCIQFKISLMRINETDAPLLEQLNMKFSPAYEFTRPLEDSEPAPFTPDFPPAGEKGFVVADVGGELHFQGTGELVRFPGFQVREGWTDAHSTGRDYADVVCGFAKKYGFNMIKFEFEDIGVADAETRMTMYDPFIARCEELGIYFFYRFSPHAWWLDTLQFEIPLGHIGPFYFTDQEAIDSYKAYVTTILEHENSITGIKIKDDPAFAIFEWANEESLIHAWRMDAHDGIDPDYTIYPREIDPLWARKNRDNFNAWLRESGRYPTYNDLIDAWDSDKTYYSPIHPDDGVCNQATYLISDPWTCDLDILKYEYVTTSSGNPNIRYELRMRDTIDYMIWKEEEFYQQMQAHINALRGYNVLVAGGKPLWEPNPTKAASLEATNIIDTHPYMATDEYRGSYGGMVWNNGQSWLERLPYTLIGRSVDRRFLNKPFIIGETAYTPQSAYLSEVMMLPTIAAHAGWDEYTYFIKYGIQNGVPNPDEGMKLFDITYHSPTISLFPIMNAIFRRSDISPGERISIDLPRWMSTNFSYVFGDEEWYGGWLDPGYLLTHQVGWGSLNAGIDVPSLPDLSDPYVNEEVTFDPRHRSIIVHSPMTEGAVGNFDGQSMDITFLSFSLHQAQGLKALSVFVTSLTDDGLASSDHMLLTVEAGASNSKKIWDTYRMRNLCDDCAEHFGEGPVYMAAVEGEVSLAIDDVVTVTPLDKLGHMDISQRVEVEPVNGRVTFPIGLRHHTPWYDISLSCVDECSIDGQDMCIGETDHQICGDHDLDGCLEWSEVQSCGTTVCDASIHLAGSCDNQCALTDGLEGECQDCIPLYGEGEVCSCQSGWWDINGYPVDGCEYACTSSNGGVEICGNGVDEDCDGSDELCPAECEITGAQWEQTTATEYQRVILRVNTQYCAGKTLEASIYEDDPFGGDIPATKQPAQVTIIQDEIRLSWTAEYIQDFYSDPEWMFDATVVEDSIMMTSANALTVAPLALPTVTLIEPANSIVLPDGDVLFYCTAIGPVGVTKIKLHTDISGTMETMEEQWGSTFITIIPDVPEGIYHWNCEAEDPYGRAAFAPADYLFSVITPIDNPPAVDLISPMDGHQDDDGSVTFACDAQDDTGINRINLYTDITGVFEITETVYGDSLTYTRNGISDGNYRWNCQAIDQGGQEGWGEEDYQFTTHIVIPPPPCELVTSYWNQLDAMEGEEVSLTIETTGCAGEQVDVFIYEYDADNNEPATQQPS